MNKNINNRGRIIFWNTMTSVFAGLAILTVLRGAHTGLAMVLFALLAGLMLLCMLARYSVTAPVKIQAATPAVDVTDDESEAEASESCGVNPATGQVMYGWTDATGHAFGSGHRSFE